MKPILMLMLTTSVALAEIDNTTGNSGGNNTDNSTNNEFNNCDVTIYNTKKLVIKNGVNGDSDSPQEYSTKGHWTLGIQYISVLAGENVKVLNKGLGLQAQILRQHPSKSFTQGIRFGYAQYDDILVKNNLYAETGYSDIDNMVKVEKALPYKSGNISFLIGGKYIQGVIGYGFLTNEDVFIIGINGQTNTKIGLTASFNNLFTANKYSPELGIGLTVKIN